MNGHDEEAFERAYGPGDADEWGPRLDDDELIEEGPDCPYCGHPVDVLTGAVVCTNCEVTWATAADMATDAANLAAEGWAR